jgi:hypothetical protein
MMSYTVAGLAIHEGRDQGDEFIGHDTNGATAMTATATPRLSGTHHVADANLRTKTGYGVNFSVN